MDTLGAEGCQQFIEAANPTHPSLLDQHHVLAERFGVINIPSAIWIDETGIIVRPAEAAPAPPKAVRTDVPAQEKSVDSPPPQDLPQRFIEMRAEVIQMRSNPEEYHAALRDWVAKGSDSEFAMDAETVIQRSRPRNEDIARGHAHFELATQLEMDGHHHAAINHFREAHQLVPDSWTFRRQAWSLEKVGDGPFARFWQGPVPDDENAWPYEGDWLSDVRKSGPENYSELFKK
jgi:hypothetical protein